MSRFRFALPAIAAVLLAVPAARAARAADDAYPDAAAVKATVAKGYEALKAKQADDGSFLAKFTGPGTTALVVAALAQNGYGPDDPVVAKAMKFLEKAVLDDGSISVKDGPIPTYTTALGVMALKDVNADGRYDKVIANAVKFLKGVQDSNGTDDKQLSFGGTGYKAGGRPDTSNTGFFMEALVAAGATKDDPAMKKAVAFLTRAQNLTGEEANDQPFARNATDDDKGGFVYNPSDADNDKSPKRTKDGGLRSEGGMTYTGLKSFLYAGISRDDKRVKAAVKWIQNHYTLDENPGSGKAGLFYYYHTFAKAMAALGDDTFEDAKGVKHPWRKELYDALAKAQGKDGSWANSDRAFMESAPELSTAFALLSLSYTAPKK